MNLLSYRLPTWAHRGDSCPVGMGGYNHLGCCWRWSIPTELQNRVTNNLLEHLANKIRVWIDISNGTLQPGDCCLSMTDSTMSAGWLVKSNFNDDPELTDEEKGDPTQAAVRAEVCRKHAMMMLENDLCEYSQWLEGDKNNVADSLSRDDNVPNHILTSLLKSHYPEQVPRRLVIAPLPNEISSWLTSLLQKLPVRMQSQERHTRTKIGLSFDGKNMPNPLASRTTSSLTPSQNHKDAGSWEPLLTPSEAADSLAHLMTPWLEGQSSIPSHLWLRPSGKMTGQTPPLTRMGSLEEFYHSNTGHTKTKTHHSSNKKPSPAAF